MGTVGTEISMNGIHKIRNSIIKTKPVGDGQRIEWLARNVENVG